MADYLLEIGTEELPAGYVPEAQAKLEQFIDEGLRSARLTFKSVHSFSTPRRLAVIVKDLSHKQETTSEQRKGPPVSRGFNPDGTPNIAATSFANKNNVKVEDLKREKEKDVEYLFAHVTIEGKTAKQVLQELVPQSISELPQERPMRWGSGDLKFSRPIRWIVSLLGSEVVPITLAGIQTGDQSRGHRILHEGEVKISGADKYIDELRQAFVLVDPVERRKMIEAQVNDLARSKGGEPKQLKGALLDEVVHITEWPHAIAGIFENEYLELPDTLIETVMVHHQRYFPVKDQTAKATDHVNKNDLLPCFISIANNDKKDAQDVIKQGNERVLRARLADARFFYKDDQKTKLTERKEALAQLTFQEGLGSYADKVERLVKLTRFVADQLKLDDRLSICVEKAAELCKLDLVTNLVRELPELQGYVGSWYAEQEGAPPDVVKAIASHYSPRSTDDAIPADTVGMIVSVVDKIDNLVGLFALGKKPSGSSDPYALRRQAQGIIDICVEGLTEHPINLVEAIEQSLDAVEPQIEAWSENQPKHKRKTVDRAKVRAELSEFLQQRLRGKLLDLGAGREVVDAVIDARDPLQNLPDCVVRCTCTGNLIASPGGLDVVRVGNRIGRILGDDAVCEVDASLLQVEAEKQLWQTFNREVVKKAEGEKLSLPPRTGAEYDKLFQLLHALAVPVDAFFEKVMVNDPDPKLRNNRHALLAQIDRYFTCVADFTKLQSLLL